MLEYYRIILDGAQLLRVVGTTVVPENINLVEFSLLISINTKTPTWYWYNIPSCNFGYKQNYNLKPFHIILV